MEKDNSSYYVINDTAEDKNKYAGFWIRFAAMAIDMAVLMVVTSIYTGALFLLFSSFMSDPNNEELINAVINIITWLFGVFYFVYCTYKFGATFGKKVVGIKVISSKEEKLNLGQVITRETIGKLVSYLIFYIGFIAAGFDPKKQAFHDKIAKTLVIREK